MFFQKYDSFQKFLTKSNFPWPKKKAKSKIAVSIILFACFISVQITFQSKV